MRLCCPWAGKMSSRSCISALPGLRAGGKRRLPMWARALSNARNSHLLEEWNQQQSLLATMHLLPHEVLPAECPSVMLHSAKWKWKRNELEKSRDEGTAAEPLQIRSDQMLEEVCALSSSMLIRRTRRRSSAPWGTASAPLQMTCRHWRMLAHRQHRQAWM